MKNRVTLALVSLWLGFVVGAAGADDRPNIVLIFADDLGCYDLHCYGRAEHRTPNLDRLAAEGMKFETAYCAQPICSPSRAALMTGLCPARLHLTNYLPGRADAPTQKLRQPVIEGQLPLEEVTIAEVLKRHGYATGLFGKWHLGGKDFGPDRQGFDTVVSPRATNPGDSPDGGKGEFAITRAAQAFIEDHRDEPFFCYVPHNNPHIPLSAHPDLVSQYKDAFHPVYAAMIETLDTTIGQLLGTIDRLGLTERTIVIFTSDNGGLHVLEFPGTPATHQGEYRGGKGYLTEGGLREPLIVRWPGTIEPGSVCQTPVVLSDLVPTLIESVGLDPARELGPLDGVSLLPIFRGKSIGERSLYWHFPHYSNQGSRPGGAVRTGDWKLIEQFEDGELELYNLAHDPGEADNLAESESTRARQMHDDLIRWRTSVGAQMLTANPEYDADLHRPIYVDRDSSRLVPAKTARETEGAWNEWRRLLNEAVKGSRPVLTPATGDIRLSASDAHIVGKQLRYESEPYKNVLGYWTNAEDHAYWTFTVAEPCDYEIELQFGCGAGQGGSKVAIDIAGQRILFDVFETGHFQRMALHSVGTVPLSAGEQKLAVIPVSKAKSAVMDLRRVVLRPAPK